MDVKRQYRSPLRAQGAAATRQAIVEAARAVFLDEGYAAVTMKHVAEHAGVATATVYANFGSKTELLLALDVPLDITADLETAEAEQARAETPAALVAAGTALQRRLYERNFDYIEALRRAALADPALAGPWQAGQRRHRHAVGRMVERARSLGSLRAGLSPEAAVDLAAALAGVDLYRQLVVESGWPPQRYQEWLADALTRLLFE